MVPGTVLGSYEIISLLSAGPTHYDAAPDGRLLMVKPVADDDGAPRQLVVVQNWFEELRRLAPLK
jgi:hypothetical protein